MVVTTNELLESNECGIEPRILSRLKDGIRAGSEGLVHVLRLSAADYRPGNRMLAKKAAAA